MFEYNTNRAIIIITIFLIFIGLIFVALLLANTTHSYTGAVDDKFFFKRFNQQTVDTFINDIEKFVLV